MAGGGSGLDIHLSFHGRFKPQLPEIVMCGKLAHATVVEAPTPGTTLFTLSTMLFVMVPK